MLFFDNIIFSSNQSVVSVNTENLIQLKGFDLGNFEYRSNVFR